MTTPRDPARSDRPITTEFAATAARVYEQRHRARYRHERERFAEWIDLGGEEDA